MVIIRHTYAEIDTKGVGSDGDTNSPGMISDEAHTCLVDEPNSITAQMARRDLEVGGSPEAPASRADILRSTKI